jgi:hypothetical protein
VDAEDDGVGRRGFAGGRVEEGAFDALLGMLVQQEQHADELPGTGERPVAPVYIDGEKGPTLKGERIAEEFQELVEQYVARHFARKEIST